MQLHNCRSYQRIYTTQKQSNHLIYWLLVLFLILVSYGKLEVSDILWKTNLNHVLIAKMLEANLLPLKLPPVECSAQNKLALILSHWKCECWFFLTKQADILFDFMANQFLFIQSTHSTCGLSFIFELLNCANEVSL